MANGDITYTHAAGMGGESPLASGKYIGETGVPINIICGFLPSKIVLHNDTDDTTFIWVLGVASGSMFQIVAAGDKTLITGGPVWYGDTTDDTYEEGSAPSYEQDKDGHGFTIPATAVINTDADVVYWEAWR